MKIIVDDFAKISHAEVEVGDLTIFVGENNTGKTFLMQLIYGVVNIIGNVTKAMLFDYDLADYINDDIKSLFFEYPVDINNENISIVENFLNRFLENNKGKIIRETFKKNIPIGALKVEFDDREYNYRCLIKDEEHFNDDGECIIKPRLYLVSKQGKFRLRGPVLLDALHFSLAPIYAIMSVISSIVNNGRMIFSKIPVSVYLPASRSGLLLLSPDFFSNVKSKEMFDEGIDYDTENDGYNENEYGLTQPVYEFLEFLQTYKKSEEKSERNDKLIRFISSEMIDGTIYKDFNNIMYKPKDSDEAYPATHSSSSVNEISPVVLLLDSIRNFKYVFYDEVETCQHPKMQIQTARLITRMVNGGFRMILSTHSLAMAAAINNHIMLSSSPVKNETVKKLGYTEDDILKSSDVHAYEMVNEKGRTVVKEIKNLDFSEIGVFYDLGKGYEFSTFSDSSSAIIEKANIILNDIAMSQTVLHETEGEKNA